MVVNLVCVAIDKQCIQGRGVIKTGEIRTLCLF